MKKIILMMAMAVCLCATSASAAVVDFESLASDDGVTVGYSYTEDGFELTTTSAQPFATDGLLSPFFLGGSTYMFSDGIATDLTTMSSVDGSTFNMVSIDLAEVMGFGDVTVNFSGVKSDNSIVNQSFTLDGALGFETFLFGSDFTDLVSLSWDNQADYNAFDNITTAAPVPVPGAVWLLGAGLSGLLGLRHKA